MPDPHAWMIAILLPAPMASATMQKLLGASVPRRDGRHDLPVRPAESMLCRKGEWTLWVDHFREPWRDSDGEDVGDAEENQYSEAEARRLIAAPWSLKRAIEQCRGERRTSHAAERHCEYLMLRVPLQPGGNSLESYDALLDLAHHLLVKVDGAVMFNPRAEVLCCARELEQIRERYRAMGLPPVELIINARTFTLPGGWVLADSVGLSQLELPDQEVAFSGPALDTTEALEFVKNLAKHLIAHRTPISNGDTAGGPKGTLWEAMILGQAAIAPHRKIIRWLPENRDGMPPGLDVP